MILIFALTAGVIFACGVYMMLRRSMVRLIIGISLMTYAVNLLIFSMGDLGRRALPIVERTPSSDMADPLPQALILTAIVISFSVMAFTITLAYRASQAVHTDNLDALHDKEEEA